MVAASDATPQGTLMLAPLTRSGKPVGSEDAGLQSITVVTHWADELRAGEGETGRRRR